MSTLSQRLRAIEVVQQKADELGDYLDWIDQQSQSEIKDKLRNHIYWQRERFLSHLVFLEANLKKFKLGLEEDVDRSEGIYQAEYSKYQKNKG